MEQIEYQATYVEELACLGARSKKIVETMLNDNDDAVEAFYTIIFQEAMLSVMRKHYPFVSKNWKTQEDALNGSMVDLAKALSGGDINKADVARNPIAVAKKLGCQLFELYNRMRTDILFKSVKEWGGQLRALESYFFGVDENSVLSIRELFFSLFKTLRGLRFDIVVNIYDSTELHELVDNKKAQG